MRRHRARQRLVAGAVFVVLASGCSSGGAVLTRDASADGAGVATAVLVTSVPTTEIIAGPPPSPTALSVEEPPVTPVPVTPVPVTPIPASVVAAPVATPTAPAATAVPAAPVPATPVPATPAPATTAPIAGSQQVLAANGAEVYTLNCARCHGENGLGSQQYNAGLISVGSQYSTAGMIAELTTGHPVTFGFADRLSAEEIASVVAYVKSVFP